MGQIIQKYQPEKPKEGDSNDELPAPKASNSKALSTIVTSEASFGLKDSMFLNQSTMFTDTSTTTASQVSYPTSCIVHRHLGLQLGWDTRLVSALPWNSFDGHL